MPRSQSIRLAAIILVAAAVSAPPVWGEPRRLPAESFSLEIFARVWNSVMSIWSGAGCIIDPHGGCGSGQAATSDAGCGADPHGGCATAGGEVFIPLPTTDSGCKIDPNGGCTPNG